MRPKPIPTQIYLARWTVRQRLLPPYSDKLAVTSSPTLVSRLSNSTQPILAPSFSRPLAWPRQAHAVFCLGCSALWLDQADASPAVLVGPLSTPYQPGDGYPDHWLEQRYPRSPRSGWSNSSIPTPRHQPLQSCCNPPTVHPESRRQAYQAASIPPTIPCPEASPVIIMSFAP